MRNTKPKSYTMYIQINEGTVKLNDRSWREEEEKCPDMFLYLAFICVWVGPCLLGLINTRNKPFFSEVWLFYRAFFFHRKTVTAISGEWSQWPNFFFRFCAASIIPNNVMVLEGTRASRFSSVYLCTKHKMRTQAENLYVHRTGMAAYNIHI